jgi:hypothetical protein
MCKFDSWPIRKDEVYSHYSPPVWKWKYVKVSFHEIRLLTNSSSVIRVKSKPALSRIFAMSHILRQLTAWARPAPSHTNSWCNTDFGVLCQPSHGSISTWVIHTCVCTGVLACAWLLIILIINSLLWCCGMLVVACFATKPSPLIMLTN